jgi:hypothetical protein
MERLKPSALCRRRVIEVEDVARLYVGINRFNFFGEFSATALIKIELHREIPDVKLLTLAPNCNSDTLLLQH